MKEGRAFVKETKYAEAESKFRMAIEVSKDYPAALSGMANLCYHTSRYQEGINWTNKAIRKDPE
ncbi:MAG: hypothetical protein C0392_16605, partial [Syntrophus sp. (in: bacteria)]|nr:hypothetical protein [Syntrophus sp. (in: bacteria)]